MHGRRGRSVKLRNCRGRDQAQIYAASRGLEGGAGSWLSNTKGITERALSQGPVSVFVFAG